jgi:hypothetical protein
MEKKKLARIVPVVGRKKKRRNKLRWQHRNRVVEVYVLPFFQNLFISKYFSVISVMLSVVVRAHIWVCPHLSQERKFNWTPT